MSDAPRVAVFGPHPLLSITIEHRGSGEDEVHLHPAGQGVWVARMAGELGAHPILCGFSGGETGRTLQPLLEALPGERRLTATTGWSGCYVIDRRSGERELVARSSSPPPSRHELDDLFSTATTTAVAGDALAVCNPLPADTLPDQLYGDLVADVRANGTPVVVDLSTPRLDSALTGRPDVVKVNEWELAEYVYGPVSAPADLRAAAQRLRDAGAGAVIVSRAEQPALVLDERGCSELVPPRFERGSREGCGDSITGALAAALARRLPWGDALRLGAAAGAVNFLRRGLGTGTRRVIEEMASQVELRAL
jgi:1-phosphofructokinase